MFESTLPFGQPDLMRVSAFQRYLHEIDRAAAAGDRSATRVSTLSPSLLQDLQRFEQQGRRGDLLEVLAAALRHGRSVLAHLQLAERVLPLTAFPLQHLVHAPLPATQLLAGPLDAWEVLHVEPALHRPPAPHGRLPASEVEHYAALGPFLWELALRGRRETLLPEIAGHAAYRVSPGLDLRDIALSGTLAAAVERLRRQTTGLREIAEWPGFDRSRAQRLLNALYLQAGLMVSRSHPAAAPDGWF